MANVLIDENTMGSIANSIRGKTGGSERLKPRNMPDAIDSIPTGGGGSNADPDLPVRFFSYDGKLLYSYTVEELVQLGSFPPVPEVPGLVSDGWNWDFEDLTLGNGYIGAADIGPLYVTDDGATRIYIKLPDVSCTPIVEVDVLSNAEVALDWGDQSEIQILNTSNEWRKHTYAAPGEYVISLKRVNEEGYFYFEGDFGEGSGLVSERKSYFNENYAYHSIVRKIELGSNVAFGRYAFSTLTRLRYVTMGKIMTTIPQGAFERCNSLEMLTIPKGVTSLGKEACLECYGLKTLSLPPTLEEIKGAACQRCYNLENLVLPHHNLQTIEYRAFDTCYLVKELHFPESVEAVPEYCCSCMRGLRIVSFPGAKSIERGAFNGCYTLPNISIPAGVESIATQAFTSVPVETIYVFATTPPVLSESGALGDTGYDLVIYVPHGCLEAYQTAQYWSNYAGKMVEMPE